MDETKELFNYLNPAMLAVLLWEVDAHGFVQVELIDLEI
jgi:hypothetical protein